MLRPVVRDELRRDVDAEHVVSRIVQEAGPQAGSAPGIQDPPRRGIRPRADVQAILLGELIHLADQRGVLHGPRVIRTPDAPAPHALTLTLTHSFPRREHGTSPSARLVRVKIPCARRDVVLSTREGTRGDGEGGRHQRAASAAWYRSREDRPVAAATSAQASFRRVPDATSLCTCASASSAETTAGSAPETTTTISPFTPCSAQATSSDAVPRRTSS